MAQTATALIIGGLKAAGVAKLTGTAALVLQSAVTVAFSVGSSLVINELFGPDIPQLGSQELTVPRAQELPPRLKYFGQNRRAGFFAFEAVADGNLYHVYMLGHGESSEIVAHYLNGDPVTLAANGDVEGSRYSSTEAKFFTNGVGVSLSSTQVVNIATKLGSDDQTAFDDVAGQFNEYSPDHRLRGIFVARVVYRSVKIEEFSKVYGQGPPNYTVVAKDAKCYDPRTQSRVWSENAALVIREFLTHPDCMGIAASRIDDVSFSLAANVCDLAVDLGNSQTLKKWTLSGAYDLNTFPGDALAQMLRACDATLHQTGDGKIAIRVGKYETPTVTVDEDWILSFDAGPAQQEIAPVNSVRMRYMDRVLNYTATESNPVQDTALIAREGLEERRVDNLWIPNQTQAMTIAKRILRRARAQWRIDLVLNIRGLRLLDRRFINLTIAELGIDEAPFEIESIEFEPGAFQVIVTVQSVDPTDFDFDPLTEEGLRPVSPQLPPISFGLPKPSIENATISATQRTGEDVVDVVVITEEPGRSDVTVSVTFGFAPGFFSTTRMAIDPDNPNRHTIAVPSDGRTFYARVRYTGTTLSFSPDSDELSIALPDTIDVPAPAPATDLTVTDQAGGVAHVDWRNPNDRNAFNAVVFRSTNDTFENSTDVSGLQAVVVNGPQRYVDDPGAGTFWYWVRLENNEGDTSATVGPVSVTVT